MPFCQAVKWTFQRTLDTQVTPELAVHLFFKLHNHGASKHKPHNIPHVYVESHTSLTKVISWQNNKSTQFLPNQLNQTLSIKKETKICIWNFIYVQNKTLPISFIEIFRKLCVGFKIFFFCWMEVGEAWMATQYFVQIKGSIIEGLPPGLPHSLLVYLEIKQRW